MRSSLPSTSLGLLLGLALLLLLHAPLFAHATAHLFVVHAASNYHALSSSNSTNDVHININGTRVVSNLAYGSGAGYIHVPSGPVTVEVFLAVNASGGSGIGERIYYKVVRLTDGKHYVGAVTGSATNTTVFPYDMFLVAFDSVVASSELKSRVALFNVAPGSPALDLIEGADTTRASNVSYLNEFTLSDQFTPAWVRNYTLSDGTTKLVSMRPLTLSAGRMNYLFAMGDVYGGESLSAKRIQPPSESPASALALPLWLSLFTSLFH